MIVIIIVSLVCQVRAVNERIVCVKLHTHTNGFAVLNIA